MSKVFVVFVCGVVALALGGVCNLFQTNDYLKNLALLLQCTKYDGDAPSLGTFVTLGIDSIDLSGCTSLKSRAECDNVIETYSSNPESNLILSALGSKLLDDPYETCKCIQQYDAGLDSCIPVLDQYNQYCETFASDLVPAINPFALLNNTCMSKVVQLCPPPAHPLRPHSFNTTVSCLLNHVADLEDNCFPTLGGLVAGLFEACFTDISTLCSGAAFKGAPQVLICLGQNFQRISPACRAQMEEIAGEVVPCGNEAALYCSDQTVPDDVMRCLNATIAAGNSQVTPICEQVVNGYFRCKDAAPLPPDADDYENGDGDNNTGGKKKPGPGSGGKNKPGPGGGGGGGRGKPAPPMRSLRSITAGGSTSTIATSASSSYLHYVTSDQVGLFSSAVRYLYVNPFKSSSRSTASSTTSTSTGTADDTSKSSTSGVSSHKQTAIPSPGAKSSSITLSSVQTGSRYYSGEGPPGPPDGGPDGEGPPGPPDGLPACWAPPDGQDPNNRGGGRGGGGERDPSGKRKRPNRNGDNNGEGLPGGGPSFFSDMDQVHVERVLLFVAVVILCSAAYLFRRHAYSQSLSSTLREVAHSTRAVLATNVPSGPRYERAATSEDADTESGEWEQTDQLDRSHHPLTGGTQGGGYSGPVDHTRSNNGSGSWGPGSKDGERISRGDGVQLTSFNSARSGGVSGGNNDSNNAGQGISGVHQETSQDL